MTPGLLLDYSAVPVASSTESEWLIIESVANVSKNKSKFNGRRDWLPTFCTLQTGYLKPTVP